MLFERILFAILLALAGAAFSGWLERALPERASREGRGGAPSLPRLEATGEAQELALEGGERALVLVPIGVRKPRPVLVQLGDAVGSTKLGCSALHRLAGGSLFTLCLPADGGGKLRSALEALKERFGDYVAKGSIVLVGLGEGAAEAVVLARQEPSFFARLMLVEGGHAVWSASVASIFQKGGGERVLFVCVSESCLSRTERAQAITRSVGLEIAVADGTTGEPGAKNLEDAIRQRFAWLMSGDARFAARP